MRKCISLRSNRGFTLVELLIAFFIASLAIAGYIGANIIIQQNSEVTFERTVATQDAHRVIELMRRAAQGQEENFPENVTGAYPADVPVAGFTNLTNEQIAVSYVNPASDPLDATVTVSWTSSTRRPLTAALRTMVTQR
jgi:prepilin-type N-terminal cleavage/methylation domain-containing protein